MLCYCVLLLHYSSEVRGVLLLHYMYLIPLVTLQMNDVKSNQVLRSVHTAALKKSWRWAYLKLGDFLRATHQQPIT